MLISKLVTRIDDFSVRNNKRMQDTIVKKLSPVTFEIKIANGKVWKRHVDQIIQFSIKSNNETNGVKLTASKPTTGLRRSERLRKVL